MYKAKYYRAPKPSVNPNKNSKPKPQWVTDFSDPDKYKLSQSEMIQRKAALQSKNRQTARQDLEERRKKLQMGVIDQDTRRVYETALQSKKIDLNPPIRKNLSQMIQYERQKRQEQKYKHGGEQNQKEDEFQKEIKQTQNFIKKLQKAKKQTKIQKAVDILLDQPKSTHFGPTKNNYIIEQNTYNEEISHEDALSNIQQTIKFMEMKLFGTKKTQQSMISPIQTSKNQKQFKLEEDHDTSNNQFLGNIPNQQQNLQLSHLKMDIPIQNDDDQCMSTIRRMQQMIQSKQNVYTQNILIDSQKRTKERLNSMKYSESQAQIDFNLTMNQSEQDSYRKYKPEQQNFKKQDKRFDIINQRGFDYQAVKKNLFQQVDKLQNFSMQQQNYVVEGKREKVRKYEQQIFQSQQPRIFEKQIKPKKAKINNELQELKSMVNTTKNNLSKIRIQEIGSTSSQNMMGFDFRGSINLKKNIIKK